MVLLRSNVGLNALLLVLSSPALSMMALSMMALSATPARAAGNAAAGQADFRGTCAVCHKTTAGLHSIGPSLFGVVGRMAGSSVGYRYSAAMAAAGIRWTEETLDTYLKAPAVMVPHNKMGFAGLSDDGQRADIIAFLASLKAPSP